MPLGESAARGEPLVTGRRKPYRVGEFVSELHAMGFVRGVSESTIIRKCNAGEIACERKGPQGQRHIPARELTRVARALREPAT